MAGPEKPAPAFVQVHSSLGPPDGQLLSRPVSLETLVRSGPCHCGQPGEVLFTVLVASSGALPVRATGSPPLPGLTGSVPAPAVVVLLPPQPVSRRESRPIRERNWHRRISTP